MTITSNRLSLTHAQKSSLAASICIVFAFFLSGCGINRSSAAGSLTQSLQIIGHIHGGQQPVAGAAIQLYAAGRSGNQSDAIPLILNTTILSGSDGSFTITGDYTCPSVNDQVYVVARGGNPGLAPGTNNHALVLMGALGPCNNLSEPSYYISINERTTVAAAWALAPFMAGASNIGSSNANYSMGLANAFLNAQLLVNPNTGSIAVVSPNLTVESGKVNALADAIAPCVNSDGGEGCQALFTAATEMNGVLPTDTLSAALNIVRNPGNHVAEVFDCITPAAPFPTALTQAPNDWTMSISILGGGLYAPTALAIDAYGNAWVADYAGGVSGFSPQGVPFSPTAFGVGQLTEIYALTVDSSNNIWVTNEEQPHHTYKGSVSKLFGVNAGRAMGSIALNQVYERYTDYPESIAADAYGHILVGNYGDGTASIFSDSGGVVSSALGLGYLEAPSAIIADGNHGAWIANASGGTVTHVDASGNILANTSCCHGADGIALDDGGNVWISNYLNSSLAEVGPDGTALLENLTGGGISSPAELSVDAGKNIWVANYHGNSFSKFAANSETVDAGTAISPDGGLGRDAVVPSVNGDVPSLLLPMNIRPDASGNIWMTGYASNDLVMFLGLATPTSTPLLSRPTAP